MQPDELIAACRARREARIEHVARRMYGLSDDEWESEKNRERIEWRYLARIAVEAYEETR